MAGGPHPIPSRTRSLSPLAPMVLRLKAWESRSLPGPQSPVRQTCRHIFPLRRFWSRLRPAARIFQADLSGPRGRICISGVSLLNVDNADAGWSSPVARQAHNLKVVGSNPTPAPTKPLISLRKSGAFLLSECAEFSKSASSPQFLKRIPQVWTAAARARMPDRSQGSIRTDRGNVAAS